MYNSIVVNVDITGKYVNSEAIGRFSGILKGLNKITCITNIIERQTTQRPIIILNKKVNYIRDTQRKRKKTGFPSSLSLFSSCLSRKVMTKKN